MNWISIAEHGFPKASGLCRFHVAGTHVGECGGRSRRVFHDQVCTGTGFRNIDMWGQSPENPTHYCPYPDLPETEIKKDD